MPIKILMPALSPTMTEGTLASWQKKEGDQVDIGDVIAEIETDKATMEVEAVEEGKLGKILVEEGTEGVPVNEVIALLLEEGEDESALEGADTGSEAAKGGGDSGGDAAKDKPSKDTSSKDKPAKDEAAKSEPSKPGSEKPSSKASPSDGKAPAAPKRGEGERIFASPLARRIADQNGLDLAQVSGSGPNGRIVKADVEAALEKGVGKKAAAEAPAEAKKDAAAVPPPQPVAAGPDAKKLADAFGMPYEEVKNSGMRKTIAKRLLESKQTVPHFYLTVECELDALLDLRKQLNAKGEASGVKLSVNDLIIKASAAALRQVPAANASWTDAAILLYQRVDISIAVATDEGLITPIIKNADQKGLGAISAEMKDLAGRAREGKLKPEEYQGGNFSISNLGMFGIKEFSAIINPPQACILAVGAGEPRAVVRDGAVAIRTMMDCTLSVDHRVVDGAVGAQWLQAFKRIVEDPLSMLL